jgi:hypothetical protein
MHKDSSFQDLEGELLANALHYQDKVMETYESIPVKPGLGREFNKFAPLLALAKVIDQETGGNSYKLVMEYADKYRVNRKAEHEDTEEILLRIIIREKLTEITYKDLAARMKDEEYENYTWQRAKSDIGKLGVVKHYDKKNSPILLTIDLERAIKRAKQRGISVKEVDSHYQENRIIYKSNKFPAARNLNDIQELISQQLTNFGRHTIHRLTSEIKSNTSFNEVDIQRELHDMISEGWVIMEDE